MRLEGTACGSRVDEKVTMNFLCICQCGHSRSVACTRILHGKGYAAVAIGHMTSGDAIIPLANWADKILVMQSYFAAYVPDSQKHKIVDFDIGPDVWSNPYNQELLKILLDKVEENGW